MDTLFYDGHCPICVREAAVLRRWAGPGLGLQDLNEAQERLGEPSRLVMRTTLHLLTSEGRWLTGLDANVRAWSHTPWGLFWRPLRWPLIGPIADLLYQAWARRRYRRLYGCGACAGEH